ncbi:SusC/RagA family TonB-linked outer membrane protein [Paraflavitalea sp. CAU 1676]|uniref:SusC/RagA family TonB-linked outer membrane protein n=1 Tax=Paraflavitalea sp. CAU 1676 TaxID=3032598 RepID=UPI0023DB1DBF|nr:SusC/RagA family TonB-linked outer membrane protein [Paraflavitalea sp. CAU 1676]MDF2192600.1 SusC/RagA family TonB-linked outer membrane protein [Paraflavitalea sp. CAU 1676]
MSSNSKFSCRRLINLATCFKRALKALILTLLVLFLQGFIPGGFQVVTLNFKNAPLQNVLNEIKKQTGYSFVITDVLSAKAKPVNVNVYNARIADALVQIFQGQSLTYTVVERIIIVKERGEKKTDKGLTSHQSFLLIDVKGRVMNEQDEPVSGVSVQVKGESKIGTSTNGDGEFELRKIDPAATLVFTAVNIEMVETYLNGRRSLDVKVRGKSGKLDEVQVIAYGKTTQRFTVGNVSSVKSEDIEKQVITNPLLALQGRVPGLVVTQNNGMNGGGVTIRIQGQNSINSIVGNDPLIVIDGIPYISQMISTTTGGVTAMLGGSGGPSGSGAGSPLNYLNPNDIESIDILKDADATAIYGSRAANGAILITTKKGRMGEMKVNLNLQHGWGNVAKKIDLLGSRDYLEMRREALRNSNVSVSSTDYDLNGHWDTTRSTDWQNELIGETSRYFLTSLGLSGGTNSVQYLVGVNYNRSTAVFPGDFSDKRGSVHFSINASSANQKLKMQLSGSYLIDNNKLPGLDLTDIAMRLSPVAPTLYNGDKTLNWQPNSSGNSTWDNPLGNMFRLYENTTRNLISSALVSYQIIPGLDIRSSFGFNVIQSEEFMGNLFQSQRPQDRANFQRDARFTDSRISSFTIEPLINFKKDWRNFGRLDAVLGASIQQIDNEGDVLRGLGFISDAVMKNIRAASSIQAFNSVKSTYKYNAAFGRISYQLKEKYLLNLTARRDGSSRFGPENRFHNFASLGIGWIFSEERFLKGSSSLFSFGKIRASYGTTGNDQIGDFRYLSIYNTLPSGILPYQGIVGIYTAGLSNPYLEWEETRKLQVGLDLGFVKDRILFTFNYVRNRSSNQLLEYILPATTGTSDITSNFPATVQNTGFELAVNSINYRSRDFKWRTNANLTIPRNKLIAFPGIESSTYANSLIVGQPISLIKTAHFLGVDPLTGNYRVANKMGDPVSAPSPEDMNVWLTMFPKFYGGLSNSFEFKGIQIDLTIQFIKQLGTDYLFRSVPGAFVSGNGNQPIRVMRRWQKAGDFADVARFSTTSAGGGTGDAFWCDASFIRLKNISLSYQIHELIKRKINLQNIRLYIQAQNLFTITRFKGLDPESQSISSLPPLRMIVTGIQITF